MKAEILLSMSGIAISLTGFTGVVSVLTHRNERSPTSFDRFLLAALLQWSLIAAFAGLLPGVLQALAHPPADLWRSSLGVVVLIHAGSALWTLGRIRKLDFGSMKQLETTVVLAGFPAGLSVLAAQAAVYFGWLPDVRFAYTASVAYFLFLSALAFSFSLLVGFRES